ncbi:hypothetical protein [Alicyclobacillus suci]|uniref:hypothetical protein n=1 Tax=Alicyclobacillus suci TaxID=2816080 RepID=UPI001A8E3011|nr:hypothetical protein [Alicyclobacillus suci]
MSAIVIPHVASVAESETVADVVGTGRPFAAEVAMVEVHQSATLAPLAQAT